MSVFQDLFILPCEFRDKDGEGGAVLSSSSFSFSSVTLENIELRSDISLWSCPGSNLD